MIDLGDYLTRVSVRRRVPGEWDCCAFPSDWLQTLGYPDPMAEFRGEYASEAEAEEITRLADGLAPLFARSLDPFLPRRAYADLRAGDIGVLRVGDLEAGSIYAGKRWALVLDRGLAFASFDEQAVVAAWGVAPWAE